MSLMRIKPQLRLRCFNSHPRLCYGAVMPCSLSCRKLSRSKVFPNLSNCVPYEVLHSIEMTSYQATRIDQLFSEYECLLNHLHQWVRKPQLSNGLWRTPHGWLIKPNDGASTDFIKRAILPNHMENCLIIATSDIHWVYSFKFEYCTL